MSLTLTPVYTNSCTGANQVPFDTANWTEFNPYPANDAIQILNGFLTTTVAVQSDGQAYNTTINWAANPNQYIQYNVDSLVDNGDGATAWFYLRTDTFGNNLYRLSLTGLTSFGFPGKFGFYVDVLTGADAQGTIFTLAKSQGTGGDGQGDAFFNFTPGDQFTFAIIGPFPTGMLYVLQNGASLFSAPLNTNDGTNPVVGVSSGATGMQLNPDANSNLPSDIEARNLSVGTATGSISGVYSQPDCRHYATFPNTSINVNGTLTYTGQVSDNAAIPPTDSRKVGAPVASNISYPQNSRTPGTYGPNE